jgi:O-antigen/teichoic acid export membrane protein
MIAGIKKNTAINIAGSIVPMAVSLVTVPLYLRHIGDSRYGVLAIVWLLVGYFGLFDLGLSRATANRVAKLRDAPDGDREAVFWTAFWLNIAFGVVGGLVLWGVGGLIFSGIFHIPLELKPEILPALPWLALAVPIATASGALSGSLEGRSSFGVVNIIQIVASLLAQVIPLGTAYLVGSSLRYLIPAAVLSRLLMTFPLLWACVARVPLRRLMGPTRALIRGLFRYGAWVTVTNIVGPLLDMVDRLVIGGTLGVASVTHYAIPYNLATKLNILPAALSRSLFPHLSFEGEASAKALSMNAIRSLCAILTPAAVAGIVVMQPFLDLWLGQQTGSRSFAVGEIMLVGVWINSIAFVPYVQLQGQSRPDIVAKFHIVEIIPFLAILWIGLRTFGLVGGAVAWSIRVSADAVLLFVVGRYDFPLIKTLLGGLLVVVAACVGTVLTRFSSVPGILVRLAVLGVAIWWAIAHGLPVKPYLGRLLGVLRRRGVERKRPPQDGRAG